MVNKLVINNRMNNKKIRLLWAHNLNVFGPLRFKLIFLLYLVGFEC